MRRFFSRIDRHRIRLLSLVDQLAVSGANFVLTIILARHFSSVEFASYGISVSIVLTTQAILRNVYVVQYSIMPANRAARLAPAVWAQHLLIVGSILTATLSVIAAYGYFLDRGTSGLTGDIALTTILCSLIYLQLDFERLVSIRLGYLAWPAIASLSYLLAIGLTALALAFFNLRFATVICAISLPWLAKSTTLLWLVGRPRWRLGGKLIVRSLSRYMGWSTVAAAGFSGYTHSPVFILGSFAPPVHVAAFVAMRSFVQPLAILIRSFDIVDKLKFGQNAVSTDADIRKIFWRTWFRYAIVNILLFALIMMFSRQLVFLFFGPKYVGHENLLVGWAFIFMIGASTPPLETVLFAKERVSSLAISRCIAGSIAVVTALILCPIYYETGAIWAGLLGQLASVTCDAWIVKDVIFSGRSRTTSRALELDT